MKGLLRCLTLFLLTVLLWHIYRFVVEVSPVSPNLKWGTPLGYIFYLGFYVLIFATLVLFVRVIDRSSLNEIGLRKAPKWKAYVLLGVLFAFLARFSEILIYLLLGGTLRFYGYPSPFIIVFFIVDTLIVGLAEEGIYRGYIQKHLTHNHGFIPALLVSTILFKIYHVNFFSVNFSDVAIISLIIPFPSFGMFAGYLYYKTRENLLGPIVLHMFYDLFGTIIPIEVETANLPAGWISILGLLRWLILMFTLKILADRAF